MTLIAASTACLRGVEPLGARVANLVSAGIRDIELGAGVTMDGALESLSSRHHARFLVHNYFPPPAREFVLNLASEDDNVRGQSVRLVESALELSARLGAPFYSVHGGYITDPIGFDGHGFVFPAPARASAGQEAFDRFVDTLKPLLARARDLGVKILVENNVCIPASKGKLLLQKAEEFEALFAALGVESLGMLFDTGHMHVSSVTFGFDRTRFADRVEPFVTAFHVHDNDGSADTHQAITGDGWVMQVLGRAQHRGKPLIVEAKFPDAAALAQHIAWLRAALQ